MDRVGSLQTSTCRSGSGRGPSPGDRLRATMVADGAAGRLVRLRQVLQGTDQDATYLHFGLAASIAAGDGYELYDLKALASQHGLDLRRCGLRAGSPRPSPGDTVVTSSPVGDRPRETLREILHGCAGDVRRLAGTFNGYDGGALALRALGRLDPGAVGVEVRRQLAPFERAQRSLDDICFKAFTGKVIASIVTPLREAASGAAALGKDQAARWRFLAACRSEPERMQALRGLGVREDAARTLARCTGPCSAAEDQALCRALHQARRDLEDAHQYVSGCRLYEERALALFESFPLAVQAVRERLSIRSGSFTDAAVQKGLARGRRTVAELKIMKTVAGLVSTVIVTAVTGGLGGAAIAVKLAKGGLHKVPDVVAAQNRLRRAELGEGLGLASTGATRRAHEERNAVLGKSALEIGASVAVGKVLDLAVKASPVQHLVRPALGDDVLLKAGKLIVAQAAMQGLKRVWGAH